MPLEADGMPDRRFADEDALSSAAQFAGDERSSVVLPVATPLAEVTESNDDWRGQGVGRALMGHAEAHARERECHSAWLDTFQARGFYEALGYVPFGELEDYPPGQSRYFLRKRLVATS